MNIEYYPFQQVEEALPRSDDESIDGELVRFFYCLNALYSEIIFCGIEKHSYIGITFAGSRTYHRCALQHHGGMPHMAPVRANAYIRAPIPSQYPEPSAFPKCPIR